VPGDIGAVAKIEEIEFNAVLHDSHDEDHIRLRSLDFPTPMHSIAVETKKKGDEQRLFDVLHKLEVEDPCLWIERHPTTHETVMRGLGDLHMRDKLEKMQQQYKMDVTTKPPKIPYRETVTRRAEGHCRHKKQTGGAGQFGEVFLKIEPLARGTGFQFASEVKGGVIPTVFIPAVEKGVRQALDHGVISGYPVEDLRVIVYDGKKPRRGLEGDRLRDRGSQGRDRRDPQGLADHAGADREHRDHRARPVRGRPHLGPLEQARPGDRHRIDRRRPDVDPGHGAALEVTDYQSRLRSVTGGQGAYTVEFSHYAAVPPPDAATARVGVQAGARRG
jgi:elongation factor G